MTDLKVCCPSCSDEHSEDRNRNVIKFGKHWIEIASDCGYDLLCRWCYSTLNGRNYNERNYDESM